MLEYRKGFEDPQAPQYGGDDLGSDPKTNKTARNLFLFALGKLDFPFQLTNNDLTLLSHTGLGLCLAGTFVLAISKKLYDMRKNVNEANISMQRTSDQVENLQA